MNNDDDIWRLLDEERAKLEKLLADSQQTSEGAMPVLSQEDDDKLNAMLAELAKPNPELEATLAELAREGDEAFKAFEAHRAEDEKRLAELLAEIESRDFEAMLRDVGGPQPALPLVSQPEPKPYVDPAPNATAAEVAAWMVDTLRATGRLSQERVVSHIVAHFGRKFLYTNHHGNPAIVPDVLKAFWTMTPDVVWAHQGFYWRLRRDSDPRGRRRVRE
jgi:hypothetical protein